MPQGTVHAADGGPFYTETNWDHWIREPFNAFTSLLFLLMALYWLRSLRGRYAQHGVVTACLAMLAVGGVGGTLYHAFRAWHGFLVLDFLPIVFITITLTLWLWWRIVPDTKVLLAAFVSIFAFQRFLLAFVPRSAAINASYSIVALSILTPLLILLKRSSWRGGGRVALAVVFFAIALFFRVIDPNSGVYLTIGTHWLWHLFSAGAVWCLIGYVLRLERA